MLKLDDDFGLHYLWAPDVASACPDLDLSQETGATEAVACFFSARPALLERGGEDVNFPLSGIYQLHGSILAPSSSADTFAAAIGTNFLPWTAESTGGWIQSHAGPEFAVGAGTRAVCVKWMENMRIDALTVRRKSMKQVTGLVGLALSILGATSCTDANDADAWAVTVGDRLSVAPGLVVPEPGWIWTAIAPAELDVQAVMCDPQPSVRDWRPHAPYATVTSSAASRYAITEPEPTYPRLRAWVAMTPGSADGEGRSEPSQAHTAYGVSSVLEPPPCGPTAAYPSDWPACYSGLMAAAIVVDSVFPGCD